MIWIISGTQDGREIGAALADREQSKPEGERREILMTVVSQYGKVLAAHKGLDIEVGRFREEDMLRVIRERVSHSSLMQAIPMQRSFLRRPARPVPRQGSTTYATSARRSHFLTMTSSITQKMNSKRRTLPVSLERASF